MDKRIKLETGMASRNSRHVSRSVKVESKEDIVMKRKRSGSKSSADSSKGRPGSTGKRVRKCSDDQMVVQVKEEKIQCAMCKEAFDPSEYRRHNRIEHNFKCDQPNCDYYLESELDLTNHKKKIHYIEPNNSYSSNWHKVCEACGMNVADKKWESHKKIEHLYHCQADDHPVTGCFMRFVNRTQLTQHYMKHHSPIKSKVRQPPQQIQTEEVTVIACVPKIKKEILVKREIQEIPIRREVSIRQEIPVKKEVSTTKEIRIKKEVPIKNEMPAKTSKYKSSLSPPSKVKSPPSKSKTPVKSRPRRSESPIAGEDYWTCHLCSEFFETPEKLEKHNQQMSKKHTHHCPVDDCRNILTSNAQLLTHLWHAHQIQEKVKYCKICQDVVDVKSNAAHIKREHSSRCEIEGCSVKTVTSKTLWYHMIRKHNYGTLRNGIDEDDDANEEEEEVVVANMKSQTTQCFPGPGNRRGKLDVDQIAKEAIGEEDVEIVTQVVEPDEGDFVKCKVCEILQKRGKLLSHSAKVHKFKCHMGCDLAFTQEILLHNHCFVAHDDEEQIKRKGYLVCPDCSEFFEPNLKNSFENHVKNGTHHICYKCDRKFGSAKKEEFNFHCDYMHSNKTDVDCNSCDMSFPLCDLKLLESHKQRKHDVGPCPHCKDMKSATLLFETKERFAKHHEVEHSTLGLLENCDCLKTISSGGKTADLQTQIFGVLKNECDVKSEDAYDLSEQITDESSIDEEEIDFDFKGFKADEGAVVMKDEDPIEMYFEAKPGRIKDEFEANFASQECGNDAKMGVSKENMRKVEDKNPDIEAQVDPYTFVDDDLGVDNDLRTKKEVTMKISKFINAKVEEITEDVKTEGISEIESSVKFQNESLECYESKFETQKNGDEDSATADVNELKFGTLKYGDKDSVETDINSVVNKPDNVAVETEGVAKIDSSDLQRGHEESLTFPKGFKLEVKDKATDESTIEDNLENDKVNSILVSNVEQDQEPNNAEFEVSSGAEFKEASNFGEIEKKSNDVELDQEPNNIEFEVSSVAEFEEASNFGESEKESNDVDLYQEPNNAEFEVSSGVEIKDASNFGEIEKEFNDVDLDQEPNNVEFEVSSVAEFKESSNFGEIKKESNDIDLDQEPYNAEFEVSSGAEFKEVSNFGEIAKESSGDGIEKESGDVEIEKESSDVEIEDESSDVEIEEISDVEMPYYEKNNGKTNLSKDFIFEIQDNAVSTTENIPSPDDKVVPVEELLDSDPEVSSSYAETDVICSDSSKDIIGIPNHLIDESIPSHSSSDNAEIGNSSLNNFGQISDPESHETDDPENTSIPNQCSQDNVLNYSDTDQVDNAEYRKDTPNHIDDESCNDKVDNTIGVPDVKQDIEVSAFDIGELNEGTESSRINQDDVENPSENLICPTNQSRTLSNLVPDVIEPKNCPFNLVPYVDTDSETESIEDFEKRSAACKSISDSTSKLIEIHTEIKQKEFSNGSIFMDTAETPKMVINSAPEVIELSTDLLSTMETVDNESIKKFETEVSCQSVDELSTDISENIMETKDTESIEEACKFVLNSARKVCEVPTEVEQKEFFGGASSMENEKLIESVDNSGRNDMVRENTPHTVLVTKSSKKIIVRKVLKGFNHLTQKPATKKKRSVSSDAQIFIPCDIILNNAVKEDSMVKDVDKKTEDKALHNAVKEVNMVKDIDKKTEALQLVTETEPEKENNVTLPEIEKFLVEEACPSKEEVSRAFKRIKRASGDNPSFADLSVQESSGSSGFKFVFAKKGRKSPIDVAGAPLGDPRSDLVNYEKETSENVHHHEQLAKEAAEVFSFPLSHEQIKADPVEASTYQLLARQGKVSRKKPAKAALYPETEESQLQEFARQQQEIKRRSRQAQTGSTRVVQSTLGPVYSLSVTPGTSAVFPNSMGSQKSESLISFQGSHTATHYKTLDAPQSHTASPNVLPMLNKSLLRRVIPQSPMQFVTVPCSPQPQQMLTTPQASKRPPTELSMQNAVADSKTTFNVQPSLEAPSNFVNSLPVKPTSEEMVEGSGSLPASAVHKVRRSAEFMDHSYVMEVDFSSRDEFDLTERLDEMEKDFENSEDVAEEESVDAIKSLIDSQVANKKSSNHSSSQGTVSISDDDLGLYSSGDDAKVETLESEVVTDDTHVKNATNVTRNNEVFEEDKNNVEALHSEKNIFDEVKVSPAKIHTIQDDTYDDVDDLLLGDSDDEEDQEVTKKEPVAQVKTVTSSEPSKKKPPQFVCPECNQKFGKHEKEYNIHIRFNHNFPCKYCPLKFTYVNGLEEHTNLMHINETAQDNSVNFVCNICNKRFTRHGPYLKHKKRDHNIPCIECDMVFTNETFLEEHMQNFHGINSPPLNSKTLKTFRKSTSTVEVKFRLANGIINDSPPKKHSSRHDDDSDSDTNNADRKESFKKTPKMQLSKDGFKKSKNALKKLNYVNAISDDDTICEKCGQKFVKLEAFEHHIELPHEHQCGMKNCELSFVYQYYLDLHIYETHKTGVKPDVREKPIEESVNVVSSSRNESVTEDQISLADLAVSEDYLPGIGPQSLMGGVDPTKGNSLKGYKIPKKNSNSGFLNLSLDNSLNSSTGSCDSTPVYGSPLRSPELKCYQCDKQFTEKTNLDLHVRNHYRQGVNVLGSPPASHSVPFKCHECNLTFHTKSELDGHVRSHYSPRQYSPQSSSHVSAHKKLRCPLCSKFYEDMQVMMEHLKSKHQNGRIEKKHSFWCGLCKKGFEIEKKFEDHERLEHKYACAHCYKAYILEVDLNHHLEKTHNIQTKHKEGFTCKLCGENISEMEMFKIHQSRGHNVPCQVDDCLKRFQNKKELVAHLKSEHNIVQIRIGDDAEEEHRGYLTTERSQANIDIAEWAESWIDSPMAIDHMIKVMRGVVKSRRHDLFLDKRERDQCSGSETSRLYQLSNPGFLGGGGEKDTVVIKHLIDRVFMVNFHQADAKLRELGISSAFVYTSCVLFPETFIHQHQVQGKSREEAEQAFMEVAVDVEERKGLNQEIKEAAVRNRRDSDEDSGDEWVDHSDMEDNLEDEQDTLETMQYDLNDESMHPIQAIKDPASLEPRQLIQGSSHPSQESHQLIQESIHPIQEPQQLIQEPRYLSQEPLQLIEEPTHVNEEPQQETQMLKPTQDLKQQTLEPHKESQETLVLQVPRNESEERNEKYQNFCSD